MKRVATICSIVGLLLLVFWVSFSVGAAPPPAPVPDPLPPDPSDPPSDDPEPPKYNATGTWENTRKLIWGDCPRSYLPKYTTTAEIVQFGNSFSYDSISLDTRGITGSINGDHYRLVKIDEYGDNITTYIFDFKLESSSFGNGYFNIVTENYESGPCTYVYSWQLIKQDACTPTDTRMCLQNGRFSVRVFWEDEHGNTGDGHAIPATDDSGLFWFFSPNNMELLIKVLNGCPINNHFWVFFAATTDQKFTVRVTDLETEEQMEYINPLKNPADAVTDTSAFSTCP